MPTEVTAPAARHPLAARRILRLALGTALSLWFSQVVNWPISFIAPVFTALILGLPLPPPTLKKGILFIVALLAPMIAGISLLPFLHHARWAGVLLVALGLYYSFYYTAKGGSPVMGTFMTLGLTLIVTIGSVNADMIFLLVQSLALGAGFGLAFVWIGHALLPDPPSDPACAGKRPPPPTPNLAEARRSALRSMLIVFPVALAFLFMSGSPSYTVVMIKVASMGQQATLDQTRHGPCAVGINTMGRRRGHYRLVSTEHLAFAAALCAADCPCRIALRTRLLPGSGPAPKILDMVVRLHHTDRGPGAGGACRRRWQRCRCEFLVAPFTVRPNRRVRHRSRSRVRRFLATDRTVLRLVRLGVRSCFLQIPKFRIWS